MKTTEHKIKLEQLKEIRSASELLELVYGDIEHLQIPITPDKIIKKIKNLNLSSDIDFDDWDKAGYIKVNRKDDSAIKDISIWVNPLEPEVRRRFTTAHELGHLIHDIYPEIEDSNLSDEFIEVLNRKEGQRSFRETRANRFAGQLLMPAHLVRKEVNNLIERVNQSDKKKISADSAIKMLSELFDTSNDAMRIRLENLNIIKNKAR